MTSEPPYSSDGGSGGEGGSGARGSHGIAPVRAFVVLVLFVVAAIALVAIGTRPTVSGDAATPPATTTPTTVAGGHKTAPTTTTTTVPHSSVTVAVANATETNGLAAHYASVLTAQGWAVQSATDAATTEATSSVYYAAGQQEAAASIAATLGLKPAAVVPLTTAVPVTGVSGDDVVVVVGADLVPPAT